MLLELRQGIIEAGRPLLEGFILQTAGLNTLDTLNHVHTNAFRLALQHRKFLVVVFTKLPNPEGEEGIPPSDQHREQRQPGRDQQAHQQSQQARAKRKQKINDAVDAELHKRERQQQAGRHLTTHALDKIAVRQTEEGDIEQTTDPLKQQVG